MALNVDASRSIRNMRFFASLGRTHEDPTFPMEDATIISTGDLSVSWPDLTMESAAVPADLEGRTSIADGQHHHRQAE